MRKFAIFAAGIIATATVVLSTGAAAEESLQKQSDAAEQVILRLLYHPEVGPLFELFFRKTAPLQSTSIEMTGFSRTIQLRFHLEKAKNRYRKIYPGSYFRHRFLIKPVSFPVRKVPQIGQATCMPVSDGAAAHYKSGYTRLRSFGNLPQMNITKETNHANCSFPRSSKSTQSNTLQIATAPHNS